MISLPLALMRQFEERGPIDGPSVPTNAPYVLGIDLNRSESGCRRSPLALPTQPSINNTVAGLIGFSRRSRPHANEESE
jgi:hypothetical protein